MTDRPLAHDAAARLAELRKLRGNWLGLFHVSNIKTVAAAERTIEALAQALYGANWESMRDGDDVS